MKKIAIAAILMFLSTFASVESFSFIKENNNDGNNSNSTVAYESAPEYYNNYEVLENDEIYYSGEEGNPIPIESIDLSDESAYVTVTNVYSQQSGVSGITSSDYQVFVGQGIPDPSDGNSVNDLTGHSGKGPNTNYSSAHIGYANDIEVNSDGTVTDLYVVIEPTADGNDTLYIPIAEFKFQNEVIVETSSITPTNITYNSADISFSVDLNEYSSYDSASGTYSITDGTNEYGSGTLVDGANSTTITGLDQLTTYDNLSVNVTDTNLNTTTNIPINSFTTLKGINDVNVITDSPLTATNITATTAQVSFEVDLNSDPDIEQASGTYTISNGSTDFGNGTLSDGTNTVDITGLSPESTYGSLYVQIDDDNDDSNTTQLTINSFDTLPSINYVSVETTGPVDATNVTSSSAEVSFDVDLNELPSVDSAEGTYSITNGTNEYGSGNLVDGTNVATFNGLSPETVYDDLYIEVNDSNYPSNTTTIEISQFTTDTNINEVFTEEAQSLSASSITTTTASVDFDVDLNSDATKNEAEGTYTVTNGTETYASGDLIDSTNTASLTGLTPNTTYDDLYVEINDTNFSEISYQLSINSFTTEAEINNVVVETEGPIDAYNIGSSTANADFDVNLNSDSSKDEASGSYVVVDGSNNEFASGVLVDGKNTANISGLSPSTTYAHLTITITDDFDQTTTEIAISSFATESNINEVEADESQTIIANNITTTTADIAFDVELNSDSTKNEASGSYVITDGTTEYASDVLIDGTNTITLTGLTPDTTYDSLYVDITDENFAENNIQLNIDSFKTEEDLNSVLVTTEGPLTVKNITTTTADVTYAVDLNSDPTKGDAEGTYTLLNGASVVEEGTLSDGFQTITIDSLTPDTQYDDFSILIEDDNDTSNTSTIDINSFTTESDINEVEADETQTLTATNVTTTTADVAFDVDLNSETSKSEASGTYTVTDGTEEYATGSLVDGENTANLSDLDPNTNYSNLYVDITDTNFAVNSIQLNIQPFTTEMNKNNVDVITTGPIDATNITGTTASVDFEVNLNSAPTMAQASGSYVVTDGTTNYSTGNLEDGSNTASITGLSPVTTYDTLKVVITDDLDDSTTEIDINTFDTVTDGTNNVDVITTGPIDATNITGTTASVDFEVNLNSDPTMAQASGSYVVTDGTTNYSTGNLEDGSNTASITGLSPVTTYDNLQVIITDDKDATTTEIAINSFDTVTDGTNNVDVITTGPIDATNITGTTANVDFEVNLNSDPTMGQASGSYVVTDGTTTYSSGTLVDNSNTASITGLSPVTTYDNLQVIITDDKDATTTEIDINTFDTVTDGTNNVDVITTGPIDATNITGTTASVDFEVNLNSDPTMAQASGSYVVTDGTTNYSTGNLEDGSNTASITGLSPVTTYDTLKVVITDDLDDSTTEIDINTFDTVTDGTNNVDVITTGPIDATNITGTTASVDFEVNLNSDPTMAQASGSYVVTDGTTNYSTGNLEDGSNTASITGLSPVTTYDNLQVIITDDKDATTTEIAINSFDTVTDGTNNVDVITTGPINATNITGTTASVDFEVNLNSDPTMAQASGSYVVTDGTTNYSTGNLEDGSNTASITGLSPVTTYDNLQVIITDDKDATTTEIAINSFDTVTDGTNNVDVITTGPIDATNITGTTASVDFEVNLNSDPTMAQASGSYVVTDGTTNYSTGNLEDGSNTASITGLSPVTTYDTLKVVITDDLDDSTTEIDINTFDTVTDGTNNVDVITTGPIDATNITGTTASVDFEVNLNSDPTMAQASGSYVVTDGTTNYSTGNLEDGSNTASITGLSPVTTYDNLQVIITDDKDATTTEIAINSFDTVTDGTNNVDVITTGPIDATNITGTTASVDFEVNLNSDPTMAQASGSYVVTDGTTNYSTGNLEDGSNTASITGLSPVTTYDNLQVIITDDKDATTTEIAINSFDTVTDGTNNVDVITTGPIDATNITGTTASVDFEVNLNSDPTMAQASGSYVVTDGTTNYSTGNLEDGSNTASITGLSPVTTYDNLQVIITDDKDATTTEIAINSFDTTTDGQNIVETSDTLVVGVFDGNSSFTTTFNAELNADESKAKTSGTYDIIDSNNESLIEGKTLVEGNNVATVEFDSDDFETIFKEGLTIVLNDDNVGQVDTIDITFDETSIENPNAFNNIEITSDIEATIEGNQVTIKFDADIKSDSTLFRAFGDYKIIDEDKNELAVVNKTTIEGNIVNDGTNTIVVELSDDIDIEEDSIYLVVHDDIHGTNEEYEINLNNNAGFFSKENAFAWMLLLLLLILLILIAYWIYETYFSKYAKTKRHFTKLSQNAAMTSSVENYLTK